MPKSKSVRIGLIGAGARGELNLATLVKRHPDRMEFIAVAEAHDERREHFVNKFGLDRKFAFRDWRELVAAKVPLDGLINALPCRFHYESTLAALRAGYHVFLEKPMALTPGQCVHLVREAKARGLILMVSLQSRYNRIYSRMRKLFDDGSVGRLMAIDCAENIGYWHFILSYVRGIHHLQSYSHSFVMAKGVHDLDLVSWFAGAPATKVSSFGGLDFFREENAPPGAPERCIDGCPVFDTCEFNAVKQFIDPGKPDIPWQLFTGMSARAAKDYLLNPRFRTLAAVILHDISRENREKAVAETINGRCVFRCENDVVDHQTVSVEFENGVVASFLLNAFSVLWERTLNLHGTQGELRSADFSGRLELRTFNPGRVRKERIRYHGIIHGGGDEKIMLAFADTLLKGNDKDSLASAARCLESHLVCFAAEHARVSGEVVDMRSFRAEAEKEADLLEENV